MGNDIVLCSGKTWKDLVCVSTGSGLGLVSRLFWTCGGLIQAVAKIISMLGFESKQTEADFATFKLGINNPLGWFMQASQSFFFTLFFDGFLLLSITESINLSWRDFPDCVRQAIVFVKALPGFSTNICGKCVVLLLTMRRAKHASSWKPNSRWEFWGFKSPSCFPNRSCFFVFSPCCYSLNSRLNVLLVLPVDLRRWWRFFFSCFPHLFSFSYFPLPPCRSLKYSHKGQCWRSI